MLLYVTRAARVLRFTWLVLILVTLHAVCAVPKQAGPTALHPEDFGAQADQKSLQCTMRAGERTASCLNAHFDASALGAHLFVAGAGDLGYNNWLDTTIASISDDSTVVLAEAATKSVTAAVSGYGHDDTKALQACFDSSATRGAPCQLGAATYLFDSDALRLRNMSHISGIAAQRTTLYCGPAVVDRMSSYSAQDRSCIVNGDSTVQFTRLESFALSGAEGSLPPPADFVAQGDDKLSRRQANANFVVQVQQGFHIDLEAPNPKSSSVFEFTSFDNILVREIWGDGLWLDGYQSGRCPNYSCVSQFLTFRQTHLWYPFRNGVPPVVRSANKQLINGANLVVSGQSDQINFDGGELNGTLNGQHGVNLIANNCNDCNFWGTSAQWSEYGFVLNNVDGFRFHQGWIENVQHVVTDAGDHNSGISFDSNYMGNVGSTSDQGGYLFLTHGTGQVHSMRFNHVKGHLPDSNFVGNCAAPAITSVILTEGNTYNDGRPSPVGTKYSRCLTPQMKVAASLNVYGNRLTQVSGDGHTIIQQINMPFLDQAALLQVEGTPILLGAGGNLDLAGRTAPLTVLPGGVAEFRPSDSTGKLTLVLVSCTACSDAKTGGRQ